jgi:hypothetical protein
LAVIVVGASTLARQFLIGRALADLDLDRLAAAVAN